LDWYVVHMRVGCEQAAAARLVRVWSVEAYVPEVSRRRVGCMQVGPLFPGYIFVRDRPRGGRAPGTSDLPEAIDRTPGCGRVLRAGAAAYSVPCCVVEWLRSRVAAIEAAGGLPVGILPGACGAGQGGGLEPNVETGLAEALHGLVPPPAQVKALLHMLHQVDAVEPCAPAVKRVRRTRGQGRKIHYR
jgi:hypothetical protein